MQKAIYLTAKIYILWKQNHFRCILFLDDMNYVSAGGIFLLERENIILVSANSIADIQ